MLAHCWAHARREVIKATPQTGSPVADEVLRRIAELYKIEKEIRGQPAAERLAARQQRSRPLVEQLEVWIHAQRERLSRKSVMGVALGYLVNHWDGLRVFRKRCPDPIELLIAAARGPVHAVART